MKKEIKTKLWKVFLLDILFIIVLITAFFFIRKSLLSYTTSLQVLQGSLESIGNSNIEEATLIVDSLESNANKAFIYTFILSPLLFFLIYTFIQGFSWKIIKEQSNKYFLYFGLSSIPAFVFLIFYTIDSFTSNLLLVFGLIFGFIAFILYINPSQSIFKKVLRKFYYYIPLYVIYLILFIAFLLSGFLAYLSFFVGNYLSIVPIFLVITFILSFLKLILVKKFG